MDSTVRTTFPDSIIHFESEIVKWFCSHAVSAVHTYIHTYIHTYAHILYLNTTGFKAQSLWSRVKIITNEDRTMLKIGITTCLQNTATIKTPKNIH